MNEYISNSLLGWKINECIENGRLELFWIHNF
jgi:hypothetical protein